LAQIGCEHRSAIEDKWQVQRRDLPRNSHAGTYPTGDALVALGYAIVFLVFHENSFTSAVIEVGAGQQVVTTGPYALVRHPMYAGTFLAFLGTPIALGSWWGLVSAILLAGLTVWRLRDEEEYLDRNLAGYADYRRNVRWRLVPWLW
jgi:protein-S-isoprenylcysteine O-methyltransferase Ste14